MKYFNSIFTGAMTKQYARDYDIIGTSKHKKIFKEVRAFFIKSAKYLQTSMPVLIKKRSFQSLTFHSLKFKTPSYARWIACVNAKDPNSVITDKGALESELVEYQATPDDEFPVYYDEMISPCALITCGTKCLNKLLNALVNLVLNAL